MLAEYARALERIFDKDEEAHERANELLNEAVRQFTRIEASLSHADRRHNAYVWRLLPDDAQRADETAYEKLARIGYGGYGTNLRVYKHHNAAAQAAKRQERGEEVSSDTQNSNLKAHIAAGRPQSIFPR